MNQQIFRYLKRTCNCGFSDDNVLSNFFICGQQDHQIIYRAQIIGTGNYSAIALAELLQNLIQTDMAYVTINYFKLKLDPTCPTRLDTFDDPECPTTTVETSTSPTTIKATAPKTKPESTTSKPTQPSKDTDKTEGGKAGKQDQNSEPQVQHSGITASQLGGMFVGLIIALLLIILIVLIIVIAFWKLGKSSGERYASLTTNHKIQTKL